MSSYAMSFFRGGSTAGVLSLLVILGAATAAAQQPSAQEPQQQQKPDKPATLPNVSLTDLHKPADPQEDTAYKAFLALKPEDSDHLIQAGEDFLKKYPTSQFAPTVYSRLTQAYFNKQALDKMFAAGEKAIELNPNDLTVLTLVGWVLPHNYNPNDLDADQKLNKAENYLKHAIDVVGGLQKPAAMTDEEFAKARNEALSRSHSGLGLVDFRRGKFAESVAELQQATQLVPNPDPTDFYVMGIDLQQVKRFDDAATAFGNCTKISSGLQERCKQSQEQSKRLAAAEPAPAKP